MTNATTQSKAIEIVVNAKLSQKSAPTNTVGVSIPWRTFCALFVLTNDAPKYLNKLMFVNGKNLNKGTFTAITLRTKDTKNKSIEIVTAPIFDLNTVEMNVESRA